MIIIKIDKLNKELNKLNSSLVKKDYDLLIHLIDLHKTINKLIKEKELKKWVKEYQRNN